MTPIRVKGKSNKIMIYQPMEVGNSDGDEGDQISFVGNVAARHSCLAMFRRLLVDGEGGVVLIDGTIIIEKMKFSNCITILVVIIVQIIFIRSFLF